MSAIAEMHGRLAAALATQPFEPFVIEVEDGRLITVPKPDLAVLNSLAISVVEAPFSVTVIGLGQITALAPGAAE